MTINERPSKSYNEKIDWTTLLHSLEHCLTKKTSPFPAGRKPLGLVLATRQKMIFRRDETGGILLMIQWMRIIILGVLSDFWKTLKS